MQIIMTTEISRPLFKAISAWAAVMLTSMWHTFTIIPWDKFAQFAAFVYSLCLLYEYIKKKADKKKLDPPGVDRGTN